MAVGSDRASPRVKCAPPACICLYAPAMNGAPPTACRDSHCRLPSNLESSCEEIPPPRPSPQSRMRSAAATAFGEFEMVDLRA